MTTPHEVAAWYEARALEHERLAGEAARRASALSNARLAAFAALVLAGAWLGSTGPRVLPVAATALALAAFVWLVALHPRTHAT